MALLLGWLGVLALMAPGTPSAQPLPGVLLAALAYVSVRALAQRQSGLVIV